MAGLELAKVGPVLSNVAHTGAEALNAMKTPAAFAAGKVAEIGSSLFKMGLFALPYAAMAWLVKGSLETIVKGKQSFI